MNRRSFFKAIGGLAATIALPVDVIARELPAAWTATAIRWTRWYDLSRDAWIFGADVFIGKKISETTDEITIENPEQYVISMISDTEELSEGNKDIAVKALLRDVNARLRELNA